MRDASRSRHISCLPINRSRNPYQTLVLRGLAADGRFTATHGARGKWFAAFRTWLRDRPSYILYDWNTLYFARRSWMMTAIHGILFLLDVRIVRWLGSRIVWTIHQLPSHDARFPDLERRIQRRFARLCTWVRVMWPSSVPRAAEFLRIPTDHIRVQPEGSFIGFYPDDQSADEARRELRLGRDDLVLLYFGAVKAYKGVEELLRQFRDIRNDGVRLVIAGNCSDPEMRKRIVELAAADTRIQLHLEFIADSRIQTFFKSSDAVVLPFHRIENSGSTILAMGYGKLVIAPAIGALAERLVMQRELLYAEEGLGPMLARVVALGRDELARLGATGPEQLAAHRWEDFADCFE